MPYHFVMVRRALAPIALLVLVTGCGHPVQRKLEGRWLGDGVENFDPAEIPVVTGWVKGLSFEFSGSSVTVAIPTEDPRSGTYKVSRVHHSDVSLAMTRADGTVDVANFKLDDEHSIRWLVGGGRAVVLRRED